MNEDTVDYIRLNDIGLLNKQYFGRKSKLHAFFKKYSFHYSLKTNLRNLYSIGWRGYLGISDPHVAVSYRKADFETLWEKEGAPIAPLVTLGLKWCSFKHFQLCLFLVCAVTRS